MRIFTKATTDRIAASTACSYGVFWAIALGAAILDRKGFRPDLMYYIAGGCAAVYIVFSVLAFCRVKGSARLLQIITIAGTTLILVAFGYVFPKEGLLGRGLLVAFGQLQIAYAVGVWLLMGHRCRSDQAQTENSAD